MAPLITFLIYPSLFSFILCSCLLPDTIINYYNIGYPLYRNIHKRIRIIKETTTKIIYFAYNNKCDITNLINVIDDIDKEISRPRHITFAPTQRLILKKTTSTLTPFLKKIAPREIKISHYEFDGLKQTTKD
jgi:hypothetical protein